MGRIRVCSPKPVQNHMQNFRDIIINERLIRPLLCALCDIGSKMFCSFVFFAFPPPGVARLRSNGMEP